MTIDDLTSESSGWALHPRYNVTPIELLEYIFRVSIRLGNENRLLYGQLLAALTAFSMGNLTRDQVVNQVEVILRDEPDLRDEFKSRVIH